MSVGGTQQNDASKSLPSRGTILCVFSDSASVATYESQLSARGFTLIRARHAMHGYWLAVTVNPDAVVTDMVQANDESNELLDCIRRNVKTRALPVVALLDDVAQSKPSTSCLQSVACCFLRGTPAEELVAVLDRLIGQSPSAPSTSGRINRFDAYFADFGQMKPKSRRLVTAEAQPKFDSDAPGRLDERREPAPRARRLVSPKFARD